MDAKQALKNLKKDKYVSSMLTQELKSIEDELAKKGSDVPVAAVASKLKEALGLLEGGGPKAAPKSRRSAAPDNKSEPAK